MAFEYKFLAVIAVLWTVFILIGIWITSAAVEEVSVERQFCESSGGYYYQQYKSENICLDLKSIIK